MGLLDDAIREHLELKRRRGADPGEVARQQREALDPALDAPADQQIDDAQLDGGADDLHEPSPHESQAAPADPGEPTAQATDLSPTGQETAEIDMQSVLEAADEPSTGVSPAANATPGSEDDSFAWEMPGEHEAEQPPAEIPGQERLTFE